MKTVNAHCLSHLLSKTFNQRQWGCSGPLGFVSQLLAPTSQTVQCFPAHGRDANMNRFWMRQLGKSISWCPQWRIHNASLLFCSFIPNTNVRAGFRNKLNVHPELPREMQLLGVWSPNHSFTWNWFWIFFLPWIGTTYVSWYLLTDFS